MSDYKCIACGEISILVASGKHTCPPRWAVAVVDEDYSLEELKAKGDAWDQWNEINEDYGQVDVYATDAGEAAVSHAAHSHDSYDYPDETWVAVFDCKETIVIKVVVAELEPVFNLRN